MVKVRYQLFFVCFLIFFIFYPSITAEVSVIDDIDMMRSLMNDDSFDLKSIFFPRSAGGGYYRPIIILSYFIDKHLWGFSSSFMHLENILIHLLNVILVFAIMYKILPDEKKEYSLAPLTASIIFGVHPLVTESVDWISGRTDPLACVFVLASTYTLLSFRNKGGLIRFFVPAGFLFLGMLTKETAFAFLIGAFILLAVRDQDDHPLPERDMIMLLFVSSVSIICALYQDNYWFIILFAAFNGCALFYKEHKEADTKKLNGKIFKVVIIVVSLICLVAIVLKVRSLVYTSHINKIGNTINLILNDTSYAISVFLGASGFYLKKYFMFYPLNFAIREVDPLYTLAGIALLNVSVYQLFRRTVSSSFFLVGTILLLPSLLFAFGTIAWTAYAERYVYMTCAFWTISIVYVVAVNYNNWFMLPVVRNVVNCLVVLVVLFFGITTYQRNFVWQKNLSLIESTIKESPNFKMLRGLYITALIMKGDTAGAKRQYFIASSIPSTDYQEEYDLMMASILFSEQKDGQAIALCRYVVEKKRGNSSSAYEMLANYYNQLIKNRPDDLKVDEWRATLFDIYEKLHTLNKNPYTAYKMGQLAISAHDTRRAILYFRMAGSEFADDNEFKRYSHKLVERLERQQNTL